MAITYLHPGPVELIRDESAGTLTIRLPAGDLTIPLRSCETGLFDIPPDSSPVAALARWVLENPGDMTGVGPFLDRACEWYAHYPSCEPGIRPSSYGSQDSLTFIGMGELDGRHAGIPQRNQPVDVSPDSV